MRAMSKFYNNLVFGRRGYEKAVGVLRSLQFQERDHCPFTRRDQLRIIEPRDHIGRIIVWPHERYAVQITGHSLERLQQQGYIIYEHAAAISISELQRRCRAGRRTHRASNTPFGKSVPVSVTLPNGDTCLYKSIRTFMECENLVALKNQIYTAMNCRASIVEFGDYTIEKISKTTYTNKHL